MDYLIQEVASLPEPRPYLVLLGQMDGESEDVIKLANQHLGEANFQINTVSPTEVHLYYQAADTFVLASLREGFGRVFLEAMAHGLPCLAHDYAVTRFVLGDYGVFANFEISGGLTKLIKQVSMQDTSSNRCERFQSIYNRFSWDKLGPEYISMLEKCSEWNISQNYS
jgi:glycosyltransferase involved in cell wall biosynthesis